MDNHVVQKKIPKEIIATTSSKSQQKDMMSQQQPWQYEACDTEMMHHKHKWQRISPPSISETRMVTIVH